MTFDPEIQNLVVPWPENWQFKKPSTRSDLREIEWATARELAEQNVWRDRLKALQELGLRSDATNSMAEFGGEQLCNEMDKFGAKFPPTSRYEKSWFERLGYEWSLDQESNSRLSRRFSDNKIRFAVYWLLEMRDQKERIKALVMFSSILKVDPDADDTSRAFRRWAVLSMFEALMDSYDELTKADLICN